MQVIKLNKSQFMLEQTAAEREGYRDGGEEDEDDVVLCC